MDIPRYWAKETQSVIDSKGKAYALKCWRWSESDPEEARRLAREGIMVVAQKVRNNQRLDRYAYGEQPLREEIIDVIQNGVRQPIALLTRNVYGAIILNAAQVMFIDIDLPVEKLADRLVGLVRRYLGYPVLDQAQKPIQAIETWARPRTDWGLRIYRTRGGLRCLVTHDVFDPIQESTALLMKSLNCDPLYVMLCRRQGNFRARLTPKPWRCGVKIPPSRYPWEDRRDELRYRQWEERYNRASSGHVACKFVKQIGQIDRHPDAEIILTLHDRYACSSSDLQLA